MKDTTLIALVQDWTKTLDYQSSFDVVSKIANYLNLSSIKDDKDCHSVLNYLNTNYPYAYIEATKLQREAWNIRD